MAHKITTRADDDLLLEMIQLRVRGFSSEEIGGAPGQGASAVRVATNRVRMADVAQSGEPAKIVERAYW